MDSIIENKTFGIDKLIALGKALGFNPGKAMADISQEELASIVLAAKEKEIEKHGEWYEEVINLKTYTGLIDMYKNSPEMQKKAYIALKVHIRHIRFLEYEAVVNDDAFGPMVIFKGGEGHA